MLWPISVGRMTSFRTVLEATGANNVGIVVRESVVLAFNRGERVPVIVTIDGGWSGQAAKWPDG